MPNPMPESVTDRPTKSHEYVFLLTKEPRYFFDQEAVREPHSESTFKMNPRYGTRDNVKITKENPEAVNSRGYQTPENPGGWGERWLNPAGRNVRSVWTIPTQPYPEAHFATYPEELVRRCVLAGSPTRVCRVCGKPSERIVDLIASTEGRDNWAGQQASKDGASRKGGFYDRDAQMVGWSDCGHNDWRPGLVLDPFVGSGTSCKVARDHGRHSIGIDLSAEYLDLAARRLQQLSLLT
jgi:DNA modification methylase